MSEAIIGRIDEMGGRIDELEASIGELMAQAGVEEEARDARSNRDRATKEVRRCKRDGSRAQEQLEGSRREALKGDVHEFSNFLVSSTAVALNNDMMS